MKRLFLLVGQGTLAGMVATAPMTVFMLLMGRALPAQQHYNLPPEMLADELTERIGAKKYLEKPARVGIALAAHVGYGAVMGAIYSFCTQKLTLSPVFKGMLFGLCVWTGSYLGVLPVLQMRTTARREPWQRNILMIVAHIIWGITLGITQEYLSYEETKSGQTQGKRHI